jgi:asparagine synthase (glutamine-hydrolysing)
MCSIAGIFRFVGGPPDVGGDRARVANGLGELRRRGPDESAVCEVALGVTMGGNRLAIRCPPGVGSMPFNHDGCVCFYNGEIYNYRRWAERADSDGEAIIPAFREHGFECFSMFDGEFAVSVWDDRLGQLALVRDAFGTKPLYFAIENGELIWASSECAVARIRRRVAFCRRTVGPTYRHALAVQEPYTSFNGIWSLPPGHFLLAKGDTVEMHRYHPRAEPLPGADVDGLGDALVGALSSRLEHSGTVGVPMSGGVDSGIIAFTAERLGVDYEVFSVVSMFGRPTAETEAILRRVDRLRRCRAVHLLACDESDYRQALGSLYGAGYYSSERLDSGAIGLYVVLRAMAARGIRVMLDGTGGDELFHGYKFRDDFSRPDEWPPDWEGSPYFYSLWTTLLDYTSKVDQAGGHWSIEARFPFQTQAVLRHALALEPRGELKWPLRQVLARYCDYGPLSVMDRQEKFGFSLKGRPPELIVAEMQRAWLDANELPAIPSDPPVKFPFRIGSSSSVRLSDES